MPLGKCPLCPQAGHIISCLSLRKRTKGWDAGGHTKNKNSHESFPLGWGAQELGPTYMRSEGAFQKPHRLLRL